AGWRRLAQRYQGLRTARTVKPEIEQARCRCALDVDASLKGNTMIQPQDFRHVSYLWDDAVADKLDPVERLVYRSNILGGDQRVTNTGGGNTSAKIAMTDPLSGESVDVLWVKGSGGD